MRKPFLKKWLSYISEQTLESLSSIHNDNLHVSLVEGRYQLSTDNAIYSFEDKYTNFLKAFKRLDLDDRNIQSVLILGLGLGSIPYILEKKMKKSYEYTGVEIDEEVIYLASKYLIPNLKSNISVIGTDASIFMDQCQEKYDMITMDIFNNDFIPEQFETSYFLRRLKACLNPGGILLYNRLYYTDLNKLKTKDFFNNVFSIEFPHADYCEVEGNWVLCNQKFR